MAISASRLIGGDRERIFFSTMAVAMLVVVFAGFARTFFLRVWFPETRAFIPPETFFNFHGVVFTAWMVLLIVQTNLVRTGRVNWHRRLGTAGAGLAAAVVIIGIQAALIGARRPGGFIGVPIPGEQFLAVPLFDMVLFGTLAGLGVLWRHRPQTHKRLMLLATVNLLGAATARFPLEIIQAGNPLIMLLLPSVFILVLAGWDLYTRRRLHPATLWAGLATIASQPLRLMIMGTGPWLAFSRWLLGIGG